MRIAFVSSEVVPFSKTGGLADVSGALPKFLAELGHEVAIFTPLYRQVRQNFHPRRAKVSLSVPVGSDWVEGEVWKQKLPGSKAQVYFLGNDDYFDRDGLYGEEGVDYPDNCSRFVFFSRAVLEAIKALDFQPDIIHANDWQSGLVPVYRKLAYYEDEAITRAGTVFTIHNMAYQGLFWHWDIPLTNIGWEHFNYKELEFYGKMNFLKGGVVFSDKITTVSSTYAKEIQSDEEYGAGLEGVLSERSQDIVGILNGIDYAVWNPEKDPLIEARYSSARLKGKAECKAALQKEAGLAEAPDVPLIGMITRLADQKGLDIISEIADEMMSEDMQFVVLGTGLEKYHTLLEALGKKYPKKAGIFLKFDNKLAHMIEAGSDMFLMPSRYEPCGLNQMYSLKYGTVPVVRATGGLADTITDATAEALSAGTANGFSFEEYEGGALLETIRRALYAYGKSDVWAKLVKAGMEQDWSWGRSAREYEELYESVAAKGQKAGVGLVA